MSVLLSDVAFLYNYFANSKLMLLRYLFSLQLACWLFKLVRASC
uniref:Uncharacterized protein n=1 Tax=Anguilla anguilla TaxID=7936 RepID=A0A0E9WPQ7_ANGAN